MPRVLFFSCVFVAPLLTACGGDGDTNADPTPTLTGAQTIAGAPSRAAPRAVTSAISIDADPSSSVVDSAATRAISEQFDAVAVLEELGEPAAGYQLDLTWNSSVLEYVTIANAAEQAFPTCSPALSSAGGASFYCLRAEGSAAHAGPLARITLRCAAAGSSQVDLRQPAREVIGTKIESPPAANVTHELTLTAATITCS